MEVSTGAEVDTVRGGTCEDIEACDGDAAWSCEVDVMGEDSGSALVFGRGAWDAGFPAIVVEEIGFEEDGIDVEGEETLSFSTGSPVIADGAESDDDVIEGWATGKSRSTANAFDIERGGGEFFEEEVSPSSCEVNTLAVEVDQGEARDGGAFVDIGEDGLRVLPWRSPDDERVGDGSAESAEGSGREGIGSTVGIEVNGLYGVIGFRGGDGRCQLGVGLDGE